MALKTALRWVRQSDNRSAPRAPVNEGSARLQPAISTLSMRRVRPMKAATSSTTGRSTRTSMSAGRGAKVSGVAELEVVEAIDLERGPRALDQRAGAALPGRGARPRGEERARQRQRARSLVRREVGVAR